MPRQLSLHVDAAFGIAGDMLLSALLHLGVPADAVFEPLRKALPPFEVRTRTVKRSGIVALHTVIEPLEHAAPHRHLADVRRIVDGAKLPSWVVERAQEAFLRIAEAEAEVHGTHVEQVHFHEVGALDSLVDVLGTLLAVHTLGPPARITCSSLPLGSGTVETAHGRLPVPAPAALLLLRGVPTHAFEVGREVSTPTGIALARVLAAEFAPPALAGIIERVGCGAGTRESAAGQPPNILRVWTSSATAALESDGEELLDLVETNLDHLTGEDAGHLLELLLERGALDAFYVATLQKKSRPGFLLQVLCEPAKRVELTECIFRESGTLGVRRRQVARTALARGWEEIEVHGHKVRIKHGALGGERLFARPEYEDLRRLAQVTGRPLLELRREVDRVLHARGE